MKLPILYKLTSTGKIQEWCIGTERNKIIVIQGQVDGKKQEYVEVISKGKNIGRANETTSIQQAEFEAQAKWDKKHKKDYHLTIEDCKSKGKIANQGGYLPMLAQSYEKHAKKHLKYPCYVQPKLDGLRCIATKTEEGVKLWFRSGKEITTMAHIVKDLDIIMEVGDIYDGELYKHGGDFNTFTGAIRANKNLKSEILDQIKYHIYDVPRIKGLTEKDSYEKRMLSLLEIESVKSLKLVSTKRINNFEEAMELYKVFIEQGYEGIMFRNIDMPYEQKRSYNLLKYKEFIDDEFIIIGAEEGKGILAGHIGAFICKIEANRVLDNIGGKTYKFNSVEGTVKAKMMGKTSYLKHLFNHPEEYMGKPLTIKYQNLSKDGVPRFPVGKTIRFDK
ncbi:hypothetical protein LCGC14_1194860 [marine sediment metagenome]|uniref:ATP-dependent DNA ligase family profile domain-containing protein n=1 Tax=marine sediment metagenome TaxID=412755 RepID=A0A0F9LIN7_9ZZZZ